MSLSLASVITEGRRCFADEVALIENQNRYTYHDLADMVLSVAAFLKSKGIEQGDKIGLIGPNRPEFTICYYGILAAGGTVVSLNTLLVGDEIAYQLENSEAVGIFSDPENLLQALDGQSRVESCEWVALCAFDRPDKPNETKDYVTVGEILNQYAPLITYENTRPDDTAVVMYTSGTTGHPKGAELTHYNLWENARMVSERLFAPTEREVKIIGPGYIAIAVLPLYHSFGQTCVQNSMLFNGGAITYQKRFDPVEAVEIIHRDQVRILDAVPTIYNALLHAEGVDPKKLLSVEYGISGGAALPIEVGTAFMEKFGMKIQEGYGLTETSPVASAQPQWIEPKVGSIGRPIPGCEMKIFDENDQEVPPGSDGEVVIRGRNIMKGYLNQPEATAQVMRNGWFHSGDIGRMDEDGDFYIVDRKKDMIIRGGYNVYPREVEEVLYAHPDVQEASVIGVPDAHYGEEVKAVVAVRQDANITAEQIIEYCKKHVAAYKYPRSVDFVPELPKGPTGKILRREIREAYVKK
ncbi:MAG: long-chain fatty acid--CoA ligase [Candidatus Omnitrophica bacterium]|nr:long-chain fatty acid--CoA ligase [Candidatus Omnitrophota bacterium]